MKISTVPLVDADGRPTGGELTTIELTSDEVGRAVRAFVIDRLSSEDWNRLSDGGKVGEANPLRQAEVHIGGQSLDMIGGARVVVKRGAS